MYLSDTKRIWARLNAFWCVSLSQQEGNSLQKDLQQQQQQHQRMEWQQRQQGQQQRVAYLLFPEEWIFKSVCIAEMHP